MFNYGTRAPCSPYLAKRMGVEQINPLWRLSVHFERKPSLNTIPGDGVQFFDCQPLLWLLDAEPTMSPRSWDARSQKHGKFCFAGGSSDQDLNPMQLPHGMGPHGIVVQCITSSCLSLLRHWIVLRPIRRGPRQLLRQSRMGQSEL